jgi:hypothetical protein
MVYTPMMYGKEGGMSQEVRENRRKRSLLGTEGSGKPPLYGLFRDWRRLTCRATQDGT